MGTTIIRLRHIARRFGLEADLDTAFKAIAEGDINTALAHLALTDRALATVSKIPELSIGLRARGRIRALSEALAQHHA